MNERLLKIFEILKAYFPSTLLFISLVIYISLPIFYISQSIKLFESLYVFLSYFITIIALSISFHLNFKNKWKYKISFKIILLFIIIHQFTTSIAFLSINSIMDINGNVINLTSLALILSIFFLIMEYVMSNFPPFIFSKWIFRNFSGKAITFEKNVTDPNDFGLLIKLLSINALTYVKKNDSTVIYANPFFNGPTYFLKLNEEKTKIKFQISKLKGFSFIIDEKVQSLKNILISLGFEFKGEDNIHNTFFSSEYEYPRFSKAKKLKFIWLFFGIFSIFINKYSYDNNYFILDYLLDGSIKFYNIINEFAKENTIIVFILGILVTLFATKFENIKSSFVNWIQSLKEI